MPRILGKAYPPVKALPNESLAVPNSAMPKTTDSPAAHIGQRLLAEMQARNMSHADVAALFGVKPPSVYDWINFGRIAKKHLPRLVEIFGHSVHWWLTGDEDESASQNVGLPRGLARLNAVLQGRSDEEIDRIARAIELLMPPRQNEAEHHTRRHIIHDSEFLEPEKTKKNRSH